MLVRFSSTETESITMFGDAARDLIRMLGASGAVPGAIGAEDVPAALALLKHRLSTRPEDEVVHPANEEVDEADKNSPVQLATRAVPLIDLLERAIAAKVPVMWEVV